MPLTQAAQIETLPDRARKGRGAVSNRAGRFEPESRVATDDGWWRQDEAEMAPPVATTLSLDTSRTVIARNTSPDIGFDRSVNPYRGCEHGCIYCFARPTHAYLGMSPGLDFETKLTIKPDAPALLAEELRARNYRCETLALGTNTDPYQPVERGQRITRGILEVLRDFAHPVGIVTKSALILRDLDILGPMAAKGLASVHVSVTTLDPELSRVMEPRAASPARRLATIKALAAAGVRTGVLAAPMIPAINDHEMEAILEAAAEAGANRAGSLLLRLPLEIKDLYEEWLRTHFPDRADKALNLLRQCHKGRLYTSNFGERMRGTGPYAELLRSRFEKAAARLGLDRPRPPLRTDLFRPPPRAGDQLAFAL